MTSSNDSAKPGLLPVGTKSLLFGVHQFIFHPITVTFAWRELYHEWPSLGMLCAIAIHDWGYWGSPNMDGPEGELHSERSAKIAREWLGSFYELQVLYHSRHYARAHNSEPSKLCWADKYSIKFDPWWLYLPRAWLSGELAEYRALHGSMGEDFKTHREWYAWASERAIRMGKQQNSDGISFHPQQAIL
jgi:hypothetical protein